MARFAERPSALTPLVALGVVACSTLPAPGPAHVPLAVSAPRAADAPGAEAAAVIAATEGILAALRDRDTASLRERLDPEVRFVAVTADGPSPGTRTFGLEDFLRIVGQSAEPLVERIWSPRVEVDGPVASLWARYDFHVGDRFSHCGHAAFQYVLRDGAWRLLGEVYTVRVESCPTHMSGFSFGLACALAPGEA